MELTEIKVFPVKEEKLKAFVSVVIDHCFMVNDIKVIQGKDGMFISMPSRRKKNGKFKDVAHPLNNETRQMMESRILAEYERAIGGEEVTARPTPRPEAAAPAAATAPAPPPATRPDAAAAEPTAPAQPEAAAEPTSAERAPEAEPKPEEGGEEKSLEEIAEMHLRDSFWTS